MQRKPIIFLILSAVLCFQMAQTAVVADPYLAFKTAELKIHNDKRALHGCPPLVLNETLNAAAQAYAQSLATSHTFTHSPAARNGLYGENLYWAWWSSSSATYNNGTASTNWYSEVTNYNFATGQAIDSTKPIGHFTAMVWKATKSVGFGYYRIAETRGTTQGFAVYVVANYAPTPNVRGQYLANVPRLL